jgi:hypothetical protein
MRTVLHSQMTLGEEDIAKIKLDPKSRDDIPNLLTGLKYIYTTPEVRQKVFSILEEVFPALSARIGPPAEIKDVRAWSNGGYLSLELCAWV